MMQGPSICSKNRRKSVLSTTDSNSNAPQDTDCASLYSSCGESIVATNAEVMIQRLKSHREPVGAERDKGRSGPCREQVNTSVRTKADDAILRMKALSSQEPKTRVRSRTLTSRTESRQQRGEKGKTSNDVGL